MKINIFEGARRIATVAAVCGTLITIFVMFDELKNDRPIVSVIGGLIIGLLSFWAFVHATGWIVRGFFGIPSGKDHKA